MTLKAELLSYAETKYGVVATSPYNKNTGYTALKHAENNKMFALFACVMRSTLDLDGAGLINIVSVKLDDPALARKLRKRDGFYKGHPFRRGEWISLSLDGEVPFDEICTWVDKSFLVTAPASNHNQERPPKEWVVPYKFELPYIVDAFEASDEIVWNQSRNARAGDTAFVYVSKPVSAILFKCAIIQTGLTSEGTCAPLPIRGRKYMRIKLLHRFQPSEFSHVALNQTFGMSNIRGVRTVPESLSTALAKAERDALARPPQPPANKKGDTHADKRTKKRTRTPIRKGNSPFTVRW